ncbi:hypothetical protein EDC01DRAFT_208667 [Geopyxis carbonaria]|nr:hypothetical protein EDC01DRAFT_208667 [Geopyxis carbonaria]
MNQQRQMYIPSSLLPPAPTYLPRAPVPAAPQQQQQSTYMVPPAAQPLVIYNNNATAYPPAPAPACTSLALDPASASRRIAELLAPSSLAAQRAESHHATTAAAAEAAWAQYNDAQHAAYEAAERARLDAQALENVRAMNRAHEMAVMAEEEEAARARECERETHYHTHHHHAPAHSHSRSRSRGGRRRGSGEYEYEYEYENRPRRASRSKSRRRHRGRSVSRESTVTIEQRSTVGSDATGWEEVEPKRMILQIEPAGGSRGIRGYSYETGHSSRRRSVQYVPVGY